MTLYYYDILYKQDIYNTSWLLTITEVKKTKGLGQNKNYICFSLPLQICCLGMKFPDLFEASGFV